jgi:WD40 repeat protein
MDIASGEITASLKGHRKPIINLQFSPSKDFAVSCSSDMMILWDSKTWQLKEKLLPGPGILSCSFTPNGDHVIVAFANNSVRVYDITHMNEIARFDMSVTVLGIGRPERLTSLAISNDGAYALIGTASPVLYLWEIESAVAVRTINLKPEWGDVFGLSFVDNTVAAILCENGTLLLVSNCTHLYIYTSR